MFLGRFVAVLAVLASLASAPALADPPKFQEGGFVFTLQYGPGFWALNRQKLIDQVGTINTDLFGNQVQNTHTATVRMAYNILGYASLGAELTGTGWNLFDANRGGAGFAVGTVTLHPLQLVFMKKEVRPIPLDFGTYFGAGYGIAGQTVGMDGLLFEWGANLDWFFAKYFALGVFVRGVFFNWDKFYFDFNNKVSVPLPQTSGGAFWTFGVSLNFRAGD